MKKCKYWRFYRGINPPQCGCEKCEEKWLRMSKARAKAKHITDDCPDPNECESGCIGYCSEVDDLTEDCLSFIERNS